MHLVNNDLLKRNTLASTLIQHLTYLCTWILANLYNCAQHIDGDNSIYIESGKHIGIALLILANMGTSDIVHNTLDSTQYP